MGAVYNKLGLQNDAGEDSVLSAIDKLIKNRKDADDELDKIKDATQKMKADYEDEIGKLKAALKKCEAKLKALEDESADKDDQDKKEKAKNLIKNSVAAGRIRNDASVIRMFEEKAMRDYDSVKAMIEALPVNRKAPEIPVEEKFNTNELPTTAAGLAAKVINSLKK